jgi:hypothetical protein
LDFAKENNIDLVTVLPSFVIGPSLSHELCTTASDILGLLQGISSYFSSSRVLKLAAWLQYLVQPF